MTGDDAGDAARELARAVLEVFDPLLREEEKRDAFDEVVAACGAALARYEARMRREVARLYGYGRANPPGRVNGETS